MANRFCLILIILSVLLVSNHALTVINNVTVPNDILTQLFLKEIQSNKISVDVTVRNENKYNSVKCRLALKEIVNRFPSLEVLPFIDSWGKIPSGLLYFHMRDIGNFDQCIRTSVTFNKDVGLVNGQHCFASIPLQLDPPALPMLGLAGNDLLAQYNKISIGICVPDTCDPRLIANIFQNASDAAFHGLLYGINVSGCLTAEKPSFQIVNILGIVIFSIIGALMVLSTLYDVYSKYFEKPIVPVFLAFSVLTNGRKLFKINVNKSRDTIDCLSGIRVLSILWVMIGHCYLLTSFAPVINPLDGLPWLESAPSMYILMATVSVDTFMFLSGLLMAWLSFRELDKTKGKLNLPLMYIHRYIRVTPAIAAVILFYVSIYDYIGIGPFKRNFDKIVGNCNSNWWVTLLHLQNYINTKHMCVSQSWYLGVDTQLYLLSPLVLIPLWKWGRKFSPVMIIISFLSIGCVIGTYYTEGYNSFVGIMQPRQAQLTYYPTHTRCTVWLIGVGFGYFLHKNKGNQIRPSKMVQMVAWLVCFGMILAIVYGPYFPISTDRTTTVFEAAMYEALRRPAWGIALAWIVFACHFGFGGVINTFLSHPYWQPLTRLTYSFYLVHMAVQCLHFGSTRTEVYFSDYNEFLYFWNMFGISFMVAIVLTLSFESPILVLEKSILGGKRQQKTQPEETEKNSDWFVITHKSAESDLITRF